MRIACTWAEMFLDMAYACSRKSKDDSTQCGAVIADHFHKLISSGYNGPPSCIEDTLVPWNERPAKYAYIIHSEENALWNGVAARGIAGLNGSTIYSTHHPCSECLLRSMMLGVKEVVIPECAKPYPLSKYQVEPEEIIARQKFRKIEIVRVNWIPKISTAYPDELKPRDSED